MRKPLLAVGGLALVVFAVAVSTPQQAAAGPQDRGPLGQVAVIDGGSLNNTNTAVPFKVGGGHKVSLQSPDSGAWVCLDGAPTCTAGYPGMWLPPGAILDDTVRYRRDGGGVVGIISVKCNGGAATCEVNVFDNLVNQ
jgi:hypothetical protein